MKRIRQTASGIIPRTVRQDTPLVQCVLTLHYMYLIYWHLSLQGGDTLQHFQHSRTVQHDPPSW